MSRIVTLTVNDKQHELVVAANETLADVLRDKIGLTGTKKGCELGDCGSCTVLLDGKAVNACLVLAVQVAGRKVQTIEGLEAGGDLHPIQKAFVEKGAIQCGFCSPGMILSSHSLLQKKAAPDEHEIRRAISGNLCRCTGYQKIVEAVQAAAGAGADGSSDPQTGTARNGGYDEKI